jgi:hypothetical protein
MNAILPQFYLKINVTSEEMALHTNPLPSADSCFNYAGVDGILILLSKKQKEMGDTSPTYP